MTAAPARFGAYEVERLLGAGSFATVWLARDPVLGVHVAVKVLADNWSHDLRVRERFLEEGRLLWRLDDERLVRVHAVGETPDGRPYLVMAHADRGSLRDRLATGSLGDGSARLDLLARIADAVAVLHRHGVVHRDLTPANVLFRTRADGTEQVLVGDLGLAKALAVSSGVTGRAGTPGYMAPEQDAEISLVDARSDVYALGVLGRELLGAEVPAPVAALLAAASRREPADRPADAAAFAAALRAASAPSPSSSSPVDRRPRRVLRSAVVALVVAAAAVVAVVLVDRARRDGTTWDASHRVGVTAPSGWRAAGSGWTGRTGPDGRPAPAVVVSPDPSRWPTDPAVPGAFVGLATDAAAAGPATFLAERTHPGCTAAPAAVEAHGGRFWTIVVHSACADGRTVVEAAAVDPAGLLYVQQSGPPAPTGLLDSVRVG